MDRIMSAYNDLFNTSRDHNIREASGKGLFIHMRVMKNPGLKNSTVFPCNIPFIGIVFPSGILMKNGYTKHIGIFIKFLCIHFDDICFSGI